MLTPRVLHSATLLPNGKVLVAGGIITNRPAVRTASAEIYDPATDSWTATAPMSAARINHTATLLSNGRILVAGGNESGKPEFSAELYDPATSAWRKAGSMIATRSLATATLLPNGMVLVAGGDSEGTSELYDPTKDTWTSAGSMKENRVAHTATLLSDGRVLAVGGSPSSGNSWASAELYTPSNSTWAVTGPPSTARWAHTATLMPNGQVLVVGGGQPRPSLATAEMFDPAISRWSMLVHSLNRARRSHTATLLSDGRLLIAGGMENTNTSASLISGAELFEPASGDFIEGGDLITPRYLHTATLLKDSRVLLAGGWGTNGVLASTELYLPHHGSSATNGSLAAQLYVRIPTLPPGKPAPKEQTATDRVLSNASYKISELKWRIQDKLEEIRASATEPVYKGHPLSYWIRDVQWESSSTPQPLKSEAVEAVTHIGTNAIPFLLKWMAGNSTYFGTIHAFRILGRDARLAIPELARLATNQPESVLRAHAHEQRYITGFGADPVMALGGIGPDALPALITILTNAIAPGTRFVAIKAMSGMGTNAAPAVPTLLRYAEDENEMVASAAVSALGAVGPGNSAAVASLEEIAQGPRPYLRAHALEALSHFGKQTVPALVRSLGDTSRGSGYSYVAFHMLASSAPTEITNSAVLAVAADGLRSPDGERREWAAYVLKMAGQQADGVNPDLFNHQGASFENATNVLGRLAPKLLLGEPSP